MCGGEKKREKKIRKRKERNIWMKKSTEIREK